MIYPRRYESEPRKREIYTEACDLIMIYGLPRTYLSYKGKCNREELKEIWNFAVADCNGNTSMDYAY